MRLVRIELCNWDIQANQLMVLQPGVNLMSGENGSGKTSILDAIKVALGVTDLGADRSVDEYLRKRASPYAMVRLVADNAVDPSTRRRPLDGLGRYDSDFATLAVVYEASDDGYDPKWFLLDGDVSPLSPTFDGKPFTRKTDYLERLDKIGMGRSFRQLIRTPQGQIAGLCSRTSAELFDLLFDFIGGKQALDEWQALRARFEVEKRTRLERSEALGKRQTELDALRERLDHHIRYRGHLDQIEFLNKALPVCKALAARRKVDELTAQHEQLVEQRTAAADAARAARDAVVGLRADLARVGTSTTTVTEQRSEAQLAEDAANDALIEVGMAFGQLDELRKRAEHLPVRDAGQLATERENASQEEASARLAVKKIGDAIGALVAERARLDKGLLTPPAGIDAFRDDLRKADVPHHLLMELIEPIGEAETRHALESWLGDLRFAVAVPDVESFVRAVALARDGRFPYYVLAPDIRSPVPEGPHPFLDQVRVHEPRYLGLVRRVLRNVEWLRGDVTDTFKQRGAAVDSNGYVVDRVGGRFQGTDRYFLGRDALERRRAEVEGEIRDLTKQKGEALVEMNGARARVAALDIAIGEENDRARWEASRAEFDQLKARIASQKTALSLLRENRKKIDALLTALASENGALVVKIAAEELAATTQQGLGNDATRKIESLAPRLEAAQRDFAAVDISADAVPEPVLEHARRTTPEGLASEVAREQTIVGDFREAVRDPNLPGNVRTLELQVEDVRQELARLDAQVDDAKKAADRAYDQYVSATKRIFRHYFGQLKESGTPLGFGLEGSLRTRDDGRFDIDLQVAIGDKAPVPYGSSSLSGGQKAALSILMAMTTLRLQGDAFSTAFFIVDEPFSASDVHKIQELGAFLDRTGAQYLVSMPTTSDLARCGAWLQAVLTCTKTRGGVDANGVIRIAAPVKCSYVVRNAG